MILTLLGQPFSLSMRSIITPVSLVIPLSPANINPISLLARRWERAIQAKALLQEQENIDHEYLSITGLSDFTTASPKLIFGESSPAIKENR